MRILFLFMDGVGLGLDDQATNPFARAKMPYLQSLLGGRRLLTGSEGLEEQRTTLLALDACLGVSGLPQSATGQTTLLTGKNIPAAIGYHYGPKPNTQVAEFLRNGNLFSSLLKSGKKTAFLNAYPPQYFRNIETGHRIYSTIPLAVTHAGLSLRNIDDLLQRKALSADFTAQGWSEHLGIENVPSLQPAEAGKALADLSSELDFAFFEYWLSDYAGHRQNMEAACYLLETFDQVLEGLLQAWNDDNGVVLITSDHGNLEDLSTRRHTYNKVPALLIGAPHLRSALSSSWESLADIAPSILSLLTMT